MTPFPLSPFHSLPQVAVLVDVPIIISLLIDTPLPCFSIPRSFTSSPLLGVSSFLKLKASEKVQELLNFRYHVAVLALEGLLSASVSFLSWGSSNRSLYRENVPPCTSPAIQTYPDWARCTLGMPLRPSHWAASYTGRDDENLLTWDFRAEVSSLIPQLAHSIGLWAF